MDNFSSLDVRNYAFSCRQLAILSTGKDFLKPIFLLNRCIYSGHLPLSNVYESSMFLSWSFSLIHIISEVRSPNFWLENKCLFYCLLGHLVQANAKWGLGLQKGGFIPAVSDMATTSASKEFSCCSASGMCLRYNLTLPLFLSSL
ncbi:unnamed protein product [Sphagnum jensenii]|uniref:Uncharacterized protein n=1 Tax=Sphagnum jensenii TaxID=128206 RepID=A0ABP0XHW1_9BRYO